MSTHYETPHYPFFCSVPLLPPFCIQIFLTATIQIRDPATFCNMVVSYNDKLLAPAKLPSWRTTHCWLIPKRESCGLVRSPVLVLCVCFCVSFLMAWSVFTKLGVNSMSVEGTTVPCCVMFRVWCTYKLALLEHTNLMWLVWHAMMCGNRYEIYIFCYFVCVK